MNIVDEVVNKIDIAKERGAGVNFMVDVYRTSRSCLFPALCEASYDAARQAGEGSLEEAQCQSKVHV